MYIYIYIQSQFGKIYPQTFSQEPPIYLTRKLNDIDYIPECKSLYFGGLSPLRRASKHYISAMK